MAGLIRYQIEHESRYTYAVPARFCVMRLCLQPLRRRSSAAI